MADDGGLPKIGLSLSPLASARSQRSCLPRNSSPCLCAWAGRVKHQGTLQGLCHCTRVEGFPIVPALICSSKLAQQSAASNAEQ